MQQAMDPYEEAGRALAQYPPEEITEAYLRNIVVKYFGTLHYPIQTGVKRIAHIMRVLQRKRTGQSHKTTL